MTTERPGGITPSQTVGPYFAYCLTPGGRYPFTGAASADLATADATGERIALTLRAFDGDGAPVTDCMVELWQADGRGRYPDAAARSNAAFTGFGRAEAGEDGLMRFTTVKPGPVGPGHAPHVAVGLFARGLLVRLVTRIYFPEEPANAADPVLAGVPAGRRSTLLAAPDGPGAWRFDIRLQGADETVFFAA